MHLAIILPNWTGEGEGEGGGGGDNPDMKASLIIKIFKAL